jgi:hypothetical protein
VTTFADLRKLASLPTGTVSLCLAGELVDEIAHLERQLAELGAAKSLGDGGERLALAEQIAAKQAEMRQSTVDFRLRALPARDWTRHWAAMPAKKDEETDDDLGERLHRFYAETVSLVVVEPAMTVDEVLELVDLLHASAWNRLANSCLAVNMGSVDVPNSAAASELIGNSEQT